MRLSRQEIVQFGGLNAQALLWSTTGRHIADLPGRLEDGPHGHRDRRVRASLSPG
ncbi:hypothetical protein [Actinocrispum sp. NPDC049592]|uniref:hypothetical protein n=1 Tax=Actinocrispum sp. NPDC049592 TaxID=3154835 RepID=UPI003439A9E9